MKSIAIFLTLCAFTISAFAQPRRAVPRTVRGPAPAPTMKSVVLEDPLGKFADSGELPKAQVFAAVESARSAAEMILANDDNSLPALIGALQFAGFHIIDQKQKILFAPRWGSNGMAFYDFEVAGMLRTSQLGMASSISKIGNALAADNPDVKRLDLPKQILDALNAARSAKDQENKFFAQFIFELSRTRPLASVETPISMIQTLLIERRFLGDLIDAYAEASQGSIAPLSVPRNGLFQKRSELQFVNASLISRVGATPCEDLKDIEKIAGYESKGKKVGKLFGVKLPPLTPMSAAKSVFKPIAEQIEKVNTAISYLNLIMANINLEGKIDIPPPLPYVRTKSNTYDGEGERLLTASFRIKSKNSETINCAGKALKLVSGLDIQVPEDGPLKEVPVHWEPMYEGTGNDRYTTNFPVIHQAVPDRFKNISDLKTDENGESKIKIIGQRQSRDLTKVAVFEVPKRVRYRVSIATDKMDAKKDIPKIFWGGVDIKSGGIIGFIIEFIPEMMGKMALKAYKVEIPIKDWKPCTDDDNWGGTVTYTRDKWTPRVNIHEEANITIVAKAEGEPKTGNPTAYYEVFGYRTTDNPPVSSEDPCCEGTTTTQSGSKLDFDGKFEAPFDINFRGAENEFSLGFSFQTPMKSKNRDYLKVLSTACPYEADDGYDRTQEGNFAFGGNLSDGHYPTRYVDQGGEHLVGETSYVDADGATVNWEWDLTHCRPARKPQ
jgi:hypothetical protein